LEILFVRRAWSGVPEGGSDPVGCAGVVEEVSDDNLDS